MRSSSFLLLLATACGGADPAGPPGDGGGQPVELQGVVIDSVTLAPVSGATVTLKGAVTLTDANGRFAMQVAPAIDTASVEAPHYEPYAHFVPVTWTSGAGTPVHFRLRRLGPFPTQCTAGPLGVSAVIVDLQGRVTGEEWAQSRVELYAPAAYLATTGNGWQYLALDSVNASVTYPGASSATALSYWLIRDGRGGQFAGYCAVTKATNAP